MSAVHAQCAFCFCAQCGTPAYQGCKECLLVVYCDSACQKLHWSQHKADCRSPLAKEIWEPDWVTEERMPAFVNNQVRMIWGGNKYYWGNMPALDILRLGDNEGASYEGDLRLLFAASGDLRNVVETIYELPRQFQNLVTIHVNDKDFDIVARNLIITLLAFVAPTETQAVDCMLHIWYSAMITTAHLDFIGSYLRPLIDDVLFKITRRPDHVILGKTWRFTTGSCRAEFTKVQWKSLPSFFEVPSHLSTERAQEIRRAVTMAPERIDHLHRHLYAQKPLHRVCLQKFRHDGILLPFGHSRQLFSVPNPTFYQSEVWPMKDSADPLAGWSYPDVLRVPSGPLANDLYGKLYEHIRKRLAIFQERLCGRNFGFVFTSIDAKDLSERCQARFSRIETSNIADAGYLGMAQTALSLGHLLDCPLTNPHATLLCLFLNAVDETERLLGDTTMQMRDMRRATPFLNYNAKPRSRYDPKLVLFTAAKDYMRDGDHYFDIYMKNVDFDSVGRCCGLKLKAAHTIVEEWPLRLKADPGSSDAQAEFELLQASMHQGCERYVEWKQCPV